MQDIGTVGSDKWKEFVARGAENMGIGLTGKELNLLSGHCALLINWNKTSNLTRITEPIDVAVKHVLDSMAAASFIPQNAKVLDVGSGGGFPGIVLKILMPSLEVTLIDASRKKVSFLNHVIRSLGLKNMIALHKRTEEIVELPIFQNAFDIVVCRSFASLAIFFKHAVTLVSPSGKMIAYKKKDIAEEMESFEDLIKKTEFSMDIIPYVLPCLNLERVLVVIET